MTLSRTARILIALLLVAAAAFLWINLFATSPATSPILTRSAPSGPVQAAVPPAVPGEGSEGDPAVRGADGAAESAGDDPDAPVLPFIGGEEPRTEGEGAAGAPVGPTTPEGPPTVVAPSETDVVGRDVIVAEFPFLITAPPLVQESAEGEAATTAGAGRPGAAARASVNPFSPIIVQAAAIPESAEASPPPASPDVIEVDVPSGPTAAATAAAGAGAASGRTTPTAPAPRPVAPSSPRTTSLPRALPTGTLPVAPDLLTGTRAEAAPAGPVSLPDVAVREPTEVAEPAPALRPLGGTVATGEADPTPLSPGDVASSGTTDRPLVAGSDALSRYLRDRNVTFTGSVVGSVGVGVFRVAGTSAPVVLSLGQPLPESDIVLTDLRGQAAEFTLGDTSQVLNLDLRR